MTPRLFKLHELSDGKGVGKAVERGRSRALAQFGTVIIALTFLLSLLPGGEVQAQATWQVVTIPGLPAGVVPTGVWSSGPNDVYVSAYIPTNVPDGLVFHWDGTSWSQVLSLPGHSTGKVFGTGPSDVFVVAFKCAAGSAAGCGADRGGRIFRSTDGGANWTPQVLPAVVGVNGLGDISGTPGNVQVMAGVHIIRFDGSSWSTVFTSPFPNANPYALTVLSANEGYYTTCWGWGRWDGISWTFNGTQFDFCDVNSVWGVRDGGGALHLYTVGNNNFSNGVRVWRFNEVTPPVCVPPGSPCSFGSKFGFVFADGSGFNIGSATGIWGSGPNDIYVGGRLEPGPNNGRLYHFDGITWARVTAIGDIPTPHAIWGTGPDDVWVLLGNGQLLHSAPPNAPPIANAGGPYLVDEGSAISLDGTASSDPDLDPLTYSWSVDSALCSFDDASSATPNFTCTDNGNFNVTLTVDDGNGGADSTTAAVTVNNVAPTVSMSLGPSSVNENDSVTLGGSCTDPGTADTWTATVDWGDGSSAQSLGAVTCNAGTFSASHQYLDDDPTGTLSDVYNVTVTVTDDDLGSGSASASVTVNNVAPTVGAISVDQTLVSVGTAINAGASFTDPGTNDTHSASWDWGDTSSSAGTVSGLSVGPDSHTYNTPGVYTIELTVTDDDTGVGTSTFEFVVVYDPSAGFVTGGGWIYSNPGAYVPAPELEGKATFGFVSKYKKGATTPTGNTEFQFHAAGMNFHSDTYEWLVVNQGGSNAQFKGTGTINGGLDPNGNAFKFMIWAGDGSPDTFRIRIWWEDTDSTEYDVYDNGFDQAIGGGSIVIHTKK